MLNSRAPCWKCRYHYTKDLQVLKPFVGASRIIFNNAQLTRLGAMLATRITNHLKTYLVTSQMFP